MDSPAFGSLATDEQRSQSARHGVVATLSDLLRPGHTDQQARLNAVHSGVTGPAGVGEDGDSATGGSGLDIRKAARQPGLVDDLHSTEDPSKQPARGDGTIFISFSPLAAFPRVTPKLRAALCYAANRNGYGRPVRLACLFKTL
jgi:hypothetical protein